MFNHEADARVAADQIMTAALGRNAPVGGARQVSLAITSTSIAGFP